MRPVEKPTPHQAVALQGRDSNPRPPGYEPGKLPLLHPTCATRDSNSEHLVSETSASTDWASHAMVPHSPPKRRAERCVGRVMRVGCPKALFFNVGDNRLTLRPCVRLARFELALSTSSTWYLYRLG